MYLKTTVLYESNKYKQNKKDSMHKHFWMYHNETDYSGEYKYQTWYTVKQEGKIISGHNEL